MKIGDSRLSAASLRGSIPRLRGGVTRQSRATQQLFALWLWIVASPSAPRNDGRFRALLWLAGLSMAAAMLPWQLVAATATGVAKATVVRPSFETVCDPLSFGNIIRSGDGGQIKVTVDGKRSVDGDMLLGVVAYHASTCLVSGPAEVHYTAKAPESLTFTASGEAAGGASDALLVDEIQIFSKNTGNLSGHVHEGTSDADGKDELTIGATLHVSANAAPGTYQGIIPITIHY